uniref:ATPase 8 n=1 Tax=Spenceriella cormieri TaxID=169945 RepID=Q94VR5_9ANNE|nr:ATPase 8 [Spenceriella cormieri]
MPHLSPMSWLTAIITFWLIMMLFTSNIWWSNTHKFETDSTNQLKAKHLSWNWLLQGGWE